MVQPDRSPLQPDRSPLLPERLASGSAASVLVVDFQPFTTSRRLGELIAELEPGVAVYQIEPARDLVGRSYRSLAEMAGEYAASFTAADSAPVTTVLGYCSGAALAVRIAERLAGSRELSTVLLRPTWPGPELIGGILAKIRSELGTAPGPGPDLTGEPQPTLDHVLDILHAELRALAQTHGLDPSSRPLTELLQRYQGWFSYLLAAQDGLREQRGAAELDLQVVLDEAEPAEVPGFEPGSYRCRRLRLDSDDARATEQLAQAVSGRFGRRHDGVQH
jgi:hypothetical protein